MSGLDFISDPLNRWVMNGDSQRPAKTLMELLEQHASGAWQIRQDTVTIEAGTWEVSTCFLGQTPHCPRQHPPLLYETTVFGPEPWSDRQWRHIDKKLALDGHGQVVNCILQGLSPDDVGPIDWRDRDE